MRLRNSSFVFSMTLAAAAICAAAPPLEVAAKYNARDLEFLRMISEYSTSSKAKPLSSKLEKVALGSDKSVFKRSSMNPETGAATAEISVLPISSQGQATVYEVPMPIPRVQSQFAQNPLSISAQTKSVDVRVASDLENRSRTLLIEDRTIELPNGGRYAVEQQQSVDLNKKDFQFVSSTVSKGPLSRSVGLNQSGRLEIHFQGPNGPKIEFNPRAQKEISDYLTLNPGALIESSYATFEGSGLILVYRDTRGQRFEFSYDLSSSAPKYRYMVKQNAADTSIATRQMTGRQPYSSQGNGVKGMTTSEFLSTRRAGGSF